MGHSHRLPSTKLISYELRVDWKDGGSNIVKFKIRSDKSARQRARKEMDTLSQGRLAASSSNEFESAILVRTEETVRVFENGDF